MGKYSWLSAKKITWLSTLKKKKPNNGELTENLLKNHGRLQVAH
jgi:hypothetical protein